MVRLENKNTSTNYEKFIIREFLEIYEKYETAKAKILTDKFTENDLIKFEIAEAELNLIVKIARNYAQITN